MKQHFRYIIALAILISLILLIRGCRKTNEEKPYILQKDSITAAICLDAGMYYNQGRPVGFMYSLLETYSKAQKVSINIEIPFSDYDYWALLMEKKIDILVINMTKDSIPEEYTDNVLYSTPISDSFAWVVRRKDSNLLDNINFWFGHYNKKREYSRLENQYFRSYKLDQYIEDMMQTNLISPYDAIIKRNSNLLGWDWRLLAAVIFKESCFSMGVFSSKGAIGLMQIKESTALHYGISDIFNPANNIRAGSLHLKHLQNIYQGRDIDSANVVKFTLAAYNAGEGRIDDCINFTISMGKDYRNWEVVSRMIPLMRDPKYYNSDILKFGKFKGDETIEYVDAVLSKYEEYQFVIKP